MEGFSNRRDAELSLADLELPEGGKGRDLLLSGLEKCTVKL